HWHHDSERPPTLFPAPPTFTEPSVPEMSSPMASISDCLSLRHPAFDLRAIPMRRAGSPAEYRARRSAMEQSLASENIEHAREDPSRRPRSAWKTTRRAAL